MQTIGSIVPTSDVRVVADTIAVKTEMQKLHHLGIAEVDCVSHDAPPRIRKSNPGSQPELYLAQHDLEHVFRLERPHAQASNPRPYVAWRPMLPPVAVMAGMKSDQQRRLFRSSAEEGRDDQRDEEFAAEPSGGATAVAFSRDAGAACGIGSVILAPDIIRPSSSARFVFEPLREVLLVTTPRQFSVGPHQPGSECEFLPGRQVTQFFVAAFRRTVSRDGGP